MFGTSSPSPLVTLRIPPEIVAWRGACLGSQAVYSCECEAHLPPSSAAELGMGTLLGAPPDKIDLGAVARELDGLRWGVKGTPRFGRGDVVRPMRQMGHLMLAGYVMVLLTLVYFGVVVLVAVGVQALWASLSRMALDDRRPRSSDPLTRLQHLYLQPHGLIGALDA